MSSSIPCIQKSPPLIPSSSEPPSSPENSERVQHSRVPLRSTPSFVQVDRLRQTEASSASEAIEASKSRGSSSFLGFLSPPIAETTQQKVELDNKSPECASAESNTPPSSSVPSATSPIDSAVTLPPRDRDPLRHSRFLTFPLQTGSHGVLVHLFDGLISTNTHEIRLTRSGYYGIRLQNMNEAAWDGLYLGIGKMKAVAEFEVVPPLPELLGPSRVKSPSFSKSESGSCRELYEGREKETETRRSSRNPEHQETRVGQSILNKEKNEEGSLSTEEDSTKTLSIEDQRRYSNFNGQQLPTISITDNKSFPLNSSVSVNVQNSDDPQVTTATIERMVLSRIGVDEEEEKPANGNTPTSSEGGDDESGGEMKRNRRRTKLENTSAESISVISGKGTLICKAQQDKVVYFYVPEAQSSLKLQAYASFTLGMRLRCNYDLMYCGSPKVLPLNPLVPFLRNASILCLDGGGILGISSLKILERLELELQKDLGDSSVRLKDCFDMICGTSTGGIISLGFLTGLSIKEMINMWASISGRIFEGNRTLFSGIVFEGYDVARLKHSLVEGLGNRYMNTYTQPYCFVTSTDVKHNPYELFLLRNYTHSHLANHEYRGGSAIPVWTAAWATAAAPTYLKGPNPEELEKMGLIIHPEVQLCDGAMKANNPTMVALEEASRLSGKKLQHFIESDLDILVSIGTGQPTLKQTIEKTGIVSTFQILVNSAHLLTSSTHVHRDVLHWLGDHEDKYFRFNVPGIGDIPLDAVDKPSCDIILKATNDYLTDEKYYDIKRLVKKLSSRGRR